MWKLISQNPLKELSALGDGSCQVIVVSTLFDPTEKRLPVAPQNYKLTDNSISLLSECARALEFGGLLFIYGLPHQLAFWGQHLSSLQGKQAQMFFKYWITLDIDEAPRGATLRPSSLALLMFLKNKPGTRTPLPFHLNADVVRVPHSFCPACGQNVKDWGGKKHLMNPRGTALSDVWRDLPKILIQTHVAPDFVLARILELTKKEFGSHVHVVQSGIGVRPTASDSPVADVSMGWPPDEWDEMTNIEPNKVYRGECVSFLSKVSAMYAQGIFDLAFADPPYNLRKNYNKYGDKLADDYYIEWCNKWLEGMVRTLKPGGSLFVLNLPKWAIHHAAYLNRRLEFRHWITWDALSDPRGKIMPAHYALLYYTKPGGTPTFNYESHQTGAKMENVSQPDAPKYCLRASCMKRRKRLGDDEKVELSDVWFDIHRIKHRRDRDAHPCQLPEKLMERILLLSTNPGDLVFDPFCGTGTTAIAARKLSRDFVVVDIDSNYVRITNEKLAAMKQRADMFGVASLPKKTTRRPKAAASKKEVEIYLQKLARRIGKEPSEEDIEADNAEMLRKIDLIYPTRLAAIKRCRVVFR